MTRHPILICYLTKNADYKIVSVGLENNIMNVYTYDFNPYDVVLNRNEFKVFYIDYEYTIVRNDIDSELIPLDTFNICDIKKFDIDTSFEDYFINATEVDFFNIFDIISSIYIDDNWNLKDNVMNNLKKNKIPNLMENEVIKNETF